MEQSKIAQNDKTRLVNLLKKYKDEILLVSTSSNHTIKSVSYDDPTKLVIMLKKV